MKNQNPLSREIADRLKIARKNAGFKTAKDFAVFHHIPITTYSQHESGKRSITPEIIVNYCTKLQINPNWLLLGNISIHQAPMNQQNSQHEQHIMVDLILLKNILMKGEDIFTNEVLDLTYQELINYCFDIYDIVSSLTINSIEKEKIINLIISSYKKTNINKFLIESNSSQ